MGNQSTSGIVEEAKATNEAPDNAKQASSSEELKEENQTLIQEDETKDLQEKAAQSDTNDVEAYKKVSEEQHKESVDEDCETQTAVGSNESSLDEGRSKLNNEEQDQPCTLDIDDDDVQKNEDDLVVADTPSVEGTLSETCAHDEELERNDDPPQEEQSNSLNTTLNDLQHASLPDISAAENEKQNECLALAEEKLMMNEVGGDDDFDNTNYVDITLPPDQEIKQVLIGCSNAPVETISSDIKGNGKVYPVEIGSLSSLERDNLLDEVKSGDEMQGSIAVADNEEDNESKGDRILEKREGEPSAIEIHQESETRTIEECVLQSQPSTKIEKVSELEPEQTAQPVSSTAAEAETPFYNECKAHESREKLNAASSPRDIGVQNELRKSPSFDFGLSFDKRSEESDQTPLLYQDRTPMRSLSSCSSLRFQNRSVQTEYLGKSLRYEAVEVEEKTIRMERSNSESSMAPPLNLLNKEGKANADTRAKQEKSASDQKQEHGVKASPSRDDVAISPRENGKRKPRSSLFTTCICCTAAIS